MFKRMLSMLLIVLLMVPVLPVSVFAGEETGVAVQSVEDSEENLPAEELPEEATLVVAATEENDLVVLTESTEDSEEGLPEAKALQTQGTSESDLAVEGQEAIAQESEAVQPAQESILASSSGDVVINDLSVGSLESIVTGQGLNATEVITLAITGAGNLDAADIAYINTMSNLTVLDVADSVTVGAIGDYFLANHEKITTVTLPATSFGKDAFYQCDVLTSVSLSKTTSFDDNAFGWCDILTSVSLPSAMTFGDWAFARCDTLKSISLPKATSFSDCPFAYCGALMSVDLPEAKSFGESAFTYCDTLISVSLPLAMVFGDSAFENCDTLRNISLPSATTFGNNAFSDSKALTSVDLPLATTFGDWAFGNCDALTSVSLPKATSFGNWDFAYCKALTSISLPSATTFEDFVFYYCDALTSISLPKATSFGNVEFAYCDALISISLPSATTFGNSAFAHCHALRSVNLPLAMSFGAYTFTDCEALTSVNLPSVINFGRNLYDGITQKITMTLGSDVPTINENIFASYQANAYESIIQVPVAEVDAYDQADGQMDGLWYGWMIGGICTVDYDEGDHGSISGNTLEEVIEGENPQNVPTPVADEGFTFTGWSEEGDTTLYTSEEVSAMAIDTDRTFIAQYAEETTTTNTTSTTSTTSTTTTIKANPKTGVGLYIEKGNDVLNITPLLLSSLLLGGIGCFFIIKKKKHI